MDATLCLNTTGRPYFGEGPTAHGYHLITIGFDTNQFAQQLAIRNLDSIDIQKDNPTLLYFDTAD